MNKIRRKYLNMKGKVQFQMEWQNYYCIHDEWNRYNQSRYDIMDPFLRAGCKGHISTAITKFCNDAAERRIDLVVLLPAPVDVGITASPIEILS